MHVTTIITHRKSTSLLPSVIQSLYEIRQSGPTHELKGGREREMSTKQLVQIDHSTKSIFISDSTAINFFKCNNCCSSNCGGHCFIWNFESCKE